MPFVTQLDVYVQQPALGARARITVSLNAINVLNQKTATKYFPTELFPGQAIASILIDARRDPAELRLKLGLTVSPCTVRRYDRGWDLRARRRPSGAVGCHCAC